MILFFFTAEITSFELLLLLQIRGLNVNKRPEARSFLLKFENSSAVFTSIYNSGKQHPVYLILAYLKIY